MTAALVVGILSGIDLVFGVNAKAREHSDLRRRFIELEKEIVGVIEPTANDIRLWQQKRLTIEADEPAVLVSRLRTTTPVAVTRTIRKRRSFY